MSLDYDMKRPLGFLILLAVSMLITGCSEAPHSTKQSVVANPPDIPAPPTEQIESLPNNTEPETSGMDETAGVEQQSPPENTASDDTEDDDTDSTPNEEAPEPEH